MAIEGTASVLAVKPALAALAEAGIDDERVLASVGISPAVLAAVENRLPYESMCRFWQAAAEASGDACFGIHVAEKLPMGAYDVIEYLLSVAPTVAEGLIAVITWVDPCSRNVETRRRHPGA